MDWVLDSVRLRFLLPVDKMRGIRYTTRRVQTLILDKSDVPLRGLGSLLGKCSAARNAIMVRVLFTRFLTRVKHGAMHLLANPGDHQSTRGNHGVDWDGAVPAALFCDYSRNELIWLVKYLPNWNGKSILPESPDLEVSTDAAGSIGGALVLLPEVRAPQEDATWRTRWHWRGHELRLSINTQNGIANMAKHAMVVRRHGHVGH